MKPIWFCFAVILCILGLLASREIIMTQRKVQALRNQWLVHFFIAIRSLIGLLTSLNLIFLNFTMKKILSTSMDHIYCDVLKHLVQYMINNNNQVTLVRIFNQVLNMTKIMFDCEISMGIHQDWTWCSELCLNRLPLQRK